MKGSSHLKKTNQGSYSHKATRRKGLITLGPAPRGFNHIGSYHIRALQRKGVTMLVCNPVSVFPHL